MVNAAKTKPAPIINRLVVVGLGLIGGSFAKGLRESGLCREVVGVDLDAPDDEAYDLVIAVATGQMPLENAAEALSSWH